MCGDSLAPQPSISCELTWTQLCELLRNTEDVCDVDLCVSAGKGKWALLALAALCIQATSILTQIKLTPDAAFLLDSDAEIAVTKVSQEALKVCILNKAETLAIDFLPFYTGHIPLSLIHRSGENGLIRLLTVISTLRLPLKPNRFLSGLTWRTRKIVKGHIGPKRLRFASFGTELSAREVLTWACLMYGEKGLGVCEETGLKVSAEDIAAVLLAEGLYSTLESLIHHNKLKLTDGTVHLLIENGFISLAADTISVTPT